MSGPATVDGVEETSRAYDAVVDDARNMTEPNKRIAAAGADAARSVAPVRTGSLAGSISGSGTEKEATLTIGVAYWPFQEFGTRYVQGRRFGRAGIEAMTRAAPDAYRERMGAIIAKRT